MKKLFLTVIIACSYSGYTQNLDSLIQVYNSEMPVKERLEACFYLVDYYFRHDQDSCIYYIDALIQEGTENKEYHYSGVGYHYKGLIYYYEERMPEALGEYYEALDNYMMDKDSHNIAILYESIGNIHAKLKNNAEAAENFHKGLRWVRSDRIWVRSYIYNDLANVLKADKQLDSAAYYYDQSLKIKEELYDTSGIAITYNNLGILYELKKDLNKAEEYFRLSIDLKRQIGDTYSLAYSLPNLGLIYIKTNRVMDGVKLCQEAYDIFLSQPTDNGDMTTCECLYKGYKKLGNTAMALRYYEEYNLLKDSIFNYEKTKELINLENSYEYEQQRIADSLENAQKQTILDAQLAQGKAELDSKRKEQILLFGGIGALILIALILFSKFRGSQKQNKIIEEQKKMVDDALAELEIKNEEVLDSITYAKRIQSAILPPDDYFFDKLPDSFILYQPKDIVAGDFYWMEERNDVLLFAAADCTGHGVPGAMVSVFCNNGLNRAVRELGITEPGKVLDACREIVVKEFEKSSEKVNDGMDIALVAIESRIKSKGSEEEESKTRNSCATLHFAGAHNPLWIIRNGTNEIEEYRADKQPIGKFVDPQPYTTHHIQIGKGDLLYIFTDGYQDQFGGDKGKKFKASNFKKLLLEIRNEPMENQRQLLLNAFTEWKGNLEQLDDVCVIGVRI